jgi:hypothetical protein
MTDNKPSWTANVFIHSGEAYLPLLGWTDAGMYQQCGPVLTCPAELAPLASKLEELKARGNPTMRHPSREELDRPSPVENAMAIRGFKKMAREGVLAAVIYDLETSRKVAVSPPDASDVQVIDYDQAREFTQETPFEDIARYILETAALRQK